MKSRILQIRDMTVIEKELLAQKAGVLSFISQDEELIQAVVPYLYLDKNVYFFFEETDEVFLSINFESNVSFVAFKTEEASEDSGVKGSKFLQILCRGVIRKVEEARYGEEVYGRYVKKYYAGSEGEESYSGIRAAFIDTEEIQASSISI
ncbi:MAG: hypothetical protein HF314_08705 [Ignavibacteria bacterium]|jgi:hypothetical protein|nr:hypothetical protein [Ignavibacteria bacterium]MCU7503140.1 hypothetical protein [Ignavibacteria bacterium]MCU7518242.1 hypothetical protein [Ignavibacteria bacterium]